MLIFCAVLIFKIVKLSGIQRNLLSLNEKCELSFKYYEKRNPIDNLFDTSLQFAGNQEILEVNYLETQGRRNVSFIIGEF